MSGNVLEAAKHVRVHRFRAHATYALSQTAGQFLCQMLYWTRKPLRAHESMSDVSWRGTGQEEAHQPRPVLMKEGTEKL